MKKHIQTATWRKRRKLGKYYIKRLKFVTKTRKSLVKKSIPRTRKRLAALPKRRRRDRISVNR